jgi:Asp-tRNA(Asn)/Glu-tRNA(Gln) amidotransferase A subunit family amidase
MRLLSSTTLHEGNQAALRKPMLENWLPSYDPNVVGLLEEAVALIIERRTWTNLHGSSTENSAFSRRRIPGSERFPAKFGSSAVSVACGYSPISLEATRGSIRKPAAFWVFTD